MTGMATPISIPTRSHPFPLISNQAALVVIDMQKAFCHPDGFCGCELGADLTAIQALIPRLQTLIRWARTQGIPILFTRESHAPDLSDLSPSKALRYQNAGYPVGAPGKLGRFLIQGEPGTALLDDLHLQAEDWQLDKPAQSIFVGTTLAENLHQHGITHLIITGVTTECCVLASYRHANDLGFFSLLLEDCCAALDPQEHQAAIDVVLAEQGAIGWVTTSEQVISTVRGGNGVTG